MREEVAKIFNILVEEIAQALKTRLLGVLSFQDNNNIIDDMKASHDASKGLITIVVNDYIDYIESGRGSGKMPPTKPIIDWCRRHGIPSDNSTVYLIRRSIGENGIKPRPFIDDWMDDIDKFIGARMDDLVDIMTRELDKYFGD